MVVPAAQMRGAGRMATRRTAKGAVPREQVGRSDSDVVTDDGAGESRISQCGWSEGRLRSGGGSGNVGWEAARARVAKHETVMR